MTIHCTARNYYGLRCSLPANHCCKHVARGYWGIIECWGHFAEVLKSLRGEV